MGGWFPAELLPESIDPDFPLLDDGQLDDQVVEYLEGMPASSSLITHIQEALENEQIGIFLQNMREAYNSYPETADKEYRLVRQFLITHPCTTNLDLIDAFALLKVAKLADVQAMYKNAGKTPHLHHQNQHWLCPHCRGILRWHNNRPRCLKHNVCGRLYPDYHGRIAMPIDDDTLILKRGIHTRTCIPSIPEVNLFKTFSEKAIEVTLWPSVDRYDLHLRFADGEVWAVDVKDYKNPHLLEKAIAQDRLYDAENALKWGLGFYIVPVYRTSQQHAIYHNYLAKVRQEAKTLPNNVTIMDEPTFLKTVEQKLRE